MVLLRTHFLILKDKFLYAEALVCQSLRTIQEQFRTETLSQIHTNPIFFQLKQLFYVKTSCNDSLGSCFLDLFVKNIMEILKT